MNLKYGDKVALLVNNLGSTIPMEISIATSDTIKKLESMGVTVERVVTGPLMTSMDMAGVKLRRRQNHLISWVKFKQILHILDNSAFRFRCGAVALPKADTPNKNKNHLIIFSVKIKQFRDLSVFFWTRTFF